MWFSYSFHYGEFNLHSRPWRLCAQSCAQLYLTLCDPLDCSPPGFSVHGMLQTRILEWVAISFSRGSYRPRDRSQVSCTAGRFFTNWATRKAFMCLRVWMNSIRCKKMNVISNRLGLFGLPRWHSGKESARNAGDLASIPGSGRCPGEGNGNPLQYSCLENPMDRRAWWATVHGVSELDVTEHTHTHSYHRS